MRPLQIKTPRLPFLQVSHNNKNRQWAEAAQCLIAQPASKLRHGTWTEESPTNSTINQKYSADCDIMFMQEHVLFPLNISLLKFSHELTFYFEPAKIRSFGRPSGGLAIICHPYIESKVLFTHDHFLAISSGSIAFFNVYLATNYHDDKSERKFVNAVRELAKCPKSVTQRDLHCVVMGDFNCNLDWQHVCP